jgi:hypothetical protein
MKLQFRGKPGGLDRPGQVGYLSAAFANGTGDAEAGSIQRARILADEGGDDLFQAGIVAAGINSLGDELEPTIGCVEKG